MTTLPTDAITSEGNLHETIINPEIRHSIESYNIISFTEATNPGCALRVQQIQGESYVTAGFVFASGLDSHGRLQPELDRSRGDNVTYYYAQSIENTSPNDDEGSVRVVDIPEGGGIEDLAAYRYSKATLTPEMDAYLHTLVAESGTSAVREVAALAHTDDANPLVSFELIRHIIQEAIVKKSDETWLITFAPSAYKAVRKNFGDKVMHVVAEKVQVDVGDDRTSSELWLQPVITRPIDVLDNLVKELKSDDISESHKTTIFRTFVFMLDGLDDVYLSGEVRDYRDNVFSNVLPIKR